MYVEIITKSGDSFGGMHAYCGHDVAANTKERLAWTETLNLGTKDPDVAWRVMAATAMDAERLKREAGVGPQGRKSERGPVMHMILSWEKDEIPGLTKEQQIAAAKEAISKLGKDTSNSRKVKNGRRQYGDEHQAVIYAHNDKGHHHVHVMLNKVHPEHGRMLPDGNDQLKLQKWAMKYQERHGNEHLTPQRTLNHDARQRGEWVKYEPKLNRRDYERSQKVSEEAEQLKKQLLATQTERAWKINKEQRVQKSRHREQWQAAEAGRKERLARIEQATRDRLAAIEKERRTETALGKREVQDAYRDRWTQLYHERQAELTAFNQRETRLIGRMKNALSQIDFGKLVGVDRDAEEGKASTFREAFDVLSSSGARKEALKKQQQARVLELAKEQRSKETAVAKEQRMKSEASTDQATAEKKKDLRKARDQSARERSDLVRTNAMEQAKIKAKWKSHDLRRAAEWRELAQEHPREAPEFEKQAQQVERTTKTKPSDLASNRGPDAGTKRAAQTVDSEQNRRRQLAEQIKRDMEQADREDQSRTDKEDRGGLDEIER